jgi:hypothetical protein
MCTLGGGSGQARDAGWALGERGLRKFFRVSFVFVSCSGSRVRPVSLFITFSNRAIAARLHAVMK